jgi:FlaA1/EpsC-like NDP-sugar epimerase
MPLSAPTSSRARFRPLFSGLSRLRNRHFLLADTFVLLLTPLIALLMRLDRVEELNAYFNALVGYTLIGLLARLAVFHQFGLYRRYWRYATIDELVHIVAAVGVSTVAGYCVLLGGWKFLAGGVPLPRSLPLVDGLLTLAAVGGIRFSVRFSDRLARARPDNARPVLIVGAGDIGQIIVKQMLANPQLGLQAVGFLDDDPHKLGMKIQNLPVIGGVDSLPEAVQQLEIAQVVIAMPRASGKLIREVLSRCEEAGVPAKIVPGMNAILDGGVNVSHLRSVEIEDLLRRDPIQTDIAAVGELIRGKRVLITGGGGSIGSELCRQVMECEPSELALLGHGENSVFEIHNELRRIQARTPLSGNGSTHPVLHPYIADVRFPDRIRRVIQEFQPDIIFHAAAHKHVPLMEMHPSEAICNNVMGTRNLLDAALACGVERFVLISTDKAVNPTSVMGASKRIAELLVLRAARRSNKPYVAVRFGNVLGSRGSVVLTFKRQIAEGGPVTVSHPDMRRYFMTIPEAVQLVLQASVIGRGGEIFTLDMGEPVKIVDLAKDLIELSGLEVGRDIDIEITGIRPGEKLFEELFIPGERYQHTHHEKILIARNASSFVPHIMDEVLPSLVQAATNDDGAQIIRYLRELIPEFQPDCAADGIPALSPEEQDEGREELLERPSVAATAA